MGIYNGQEGIYSGIYPVVAGAAAATISFLDADDISYSPASVQFLDADGTANSVTAQFLDADGTAYTVT